MSAFLLHVWHNLPAILCAIGIAAVLPVGFILTEIDDGRKKRS